ncbi:hypothetical protein BVRB_2g029730 isoform B [Beta vulgaris subsp. vulgaris]|nr:hypothetical protein BVRB_2g029730 isoform B [Beta vulgaris subsp. vulgaris]
MGKKRAKKVKKAWRNISTKEIDDFNENSTRDANSGGSLASAPSDSIFVLDKSTDVPVKRKIEKKREKVLRFESILERNPFVKAVPSSILKKPKKKDIVAAVVQSQDAKVNKEGKDSESDIFDIWNDQSKENVKGKKAKPSHIPAVEVEPPGCSYNPEDESHKDSLALAVAEEMKKIYKKELEPEPIPLFVPGEPVPEEDRYFLEVGNGDDDEMDEENQTEDSNAENEIRKSKEKRITTVVRNKRIRRKDQQRAEEKAKKMDALSKEIDSIPDILQEIAEEEEEKQKKHLRRVISKEERLKSGPPRLGKRKFLPAPTQVLLTEEITGSLRKLKACCTLARDRFKSLEKRGLVIPSIKSTRK